MVWTQDDLQSLELLLESKLRDKRTPSLYNALREPERQAEPQTCKWGVTLLIYISAFCLMYFSPRKVSAAAPVAEKPPTMITEYRIEVNLPGNYTMSVPSI
ncbi:hypothetical protein KCU67_g10030, partial [Aureobasidium melanogenum]